MAIHKKTVLQLTEGETPSLQDVLHTREHRAAFQNELCLQNKNYTILAFKLNIPGPVKNNATIKQLFKRGKAELLQLLEEKDWSYKIVEEWNRATGPELFLRIDERAYQVKKATVQLENNHKIGRIWDMDVLTLNDDTIQSIKREELGFEGRTCYICERPAKECGRSRAHSVLELQQKIIEMIEEEGRF